ncbi:hypothetical protein ABGB08_41955 [Acrocarpospora sp. B8E8]
MAGGALAEQEVTGLLTGAAAQIGQPYSEASRTMASGLRAGSRRPRSIRVTVARVAGETKKTIAAQRRRVYAFLLASIPIGFLVNWYS